MDSTKCNLELTGVAPLLMSNGLNPAVLTRNEEITSDILDPEPSKKHSPEWEARTWRRTAYWKEGTDGQPGYFYIPVSAIERSIIDAGKGDKINVMRAFHCDGLEFPLITNTVIESLDDVEKAGWVVTHKARMTRISNMKYPLHPILTQPFLVTRVCVPVPWKCTIKCMVKTNVLPKDKFETLVDRAGDLIGMLDWRPNYGRFKAKVNWS